MISTIIFRESSRSLQRRQTFSLLWSRLMGGGPRTFPGGLNKWQWKRLHEKKAINKEKRLLDQEKQLYQARLRSQIRASASDQPDDPSATAPMSPQAHVKALADRFLKPGAEDLWNDDDGPINSSPKPSSSKPADPLIDPSKLQLNRGFSCFKNDDGHDNLLRFRGNLQQNRGFCKGNNYNLIGFRGNLEQKRGYPGSVKGKVKKKFYNRRIGDSSTDDDEEDFGRVSENARWPRFNFVGNAAKSEEVEKGGLKSVRGFMGNATLGKYDVKVIKRRIVKELEEYADQEEEDGDLGDTIQEIRQEVFQRKRVDENIETQESSNEDDIVASKKRRACHFNINYN